MEVVVVVDVVVVERVDVVLVEVEVVTVVVVRVPQSKTTLLITIMAPGLPSLMDSKSPLVNCMVIVFDKVPEGAVATTIRLRDTDTVP